MWTLRINKSPFKQHRVRKEGKGKEARKQERWTTRFKLGKEERQKGDDVRTGGKEGRLSIAKRWRERELEDEERRRGAS